MQEPDIIDAEYEEISNVTEAPRVNVGTIGHVDHGKNTLTDALTNISDAKYEPVPTSDLVTDVDKPKMTRAEVLEALNAAVSDGHVSAKEAKRMKRDLGINTSDFTKKQQSATKRKSKRAAQKKARRKQRK